MTPRIRSIARHYIRSCCGLLVGSVVLAGTAKAQQAKPRKHLAQEVASIRVLLTEHAQRIQNLEVRIEQLKEASSRNTATGWRAEAAWNRLRQGMSEATVIAILGRPSSVDSGPAHRILYYEEETEDRGLLRGCVKIVDEDWVELIRRPTGEDNTGPRC